jgi:two-component system response regulator YesN
LFQGQKYSEYPIDAEEVIDRMGSRYPESRAFTRQTSYGEMEMFKTLIVEDSHPFRQLLKENLHDRFRSMAIEEASNGIEAMQKMGSFCPDLIFMDIRLPGESGLDLTKRIKSQSPATKIIILTSYDLPEYRETAQKYGADHFITKGSSTWEEIATLVKSISSDLGKPI